MAIASATGGRVTGAPDDARQAANDPRLEAELNSRDGKIATQAVGPIEIAYEDVGFEGHTWIFIADHDCTFTLNDIDFSVVRLDSGIRSYRNYRGCLSKHYEFANFGGRSVGWDSGGELPFPAKSVQWS